MRRLRALLVALLLPLTCFAAEQQPEYAVKAAFVYNFARFTEWPATVGGDLVLCTYGADSFGAHLDDVEGKPVGTRTVRLRRRVARDALAQCHILYVAPEVVGELPALRQRLQGLPVLFVTDSPGAIRAGATLNMTLAQNRIAFEANRAAARASGLELSYQLLRLATEVVQ